MRQLHIDIIPDSLVYKRWTKNAKSEFIYNAATGSIDFEKTLNLRIGALAADCNQLCELACKSYEDFVILWLSRRRVHQQRICEDAMEIKASDGDILHATRKTQKAAMREKSGIGSKDGRVDTANDVTKNSGVQVAKLGNKSGHVMTDVNTPFDARMQMGHLVSGGGINAVTSHPHHVQIQCPNMYSTFGSVPMYSQGNKSADNTSYRIGGNPNQFLNPYHGMMPMYPQF
ncbi:hypothetical protein PIB30_063020 [Stylosanthes scabra]|uniref:Protein FAR1-RELATED SEQUENCE n=1 Tax=Stylosanthes scabra TaxID=79078 RepID=A0ABU6YLU7_9FABA|nr:hypothetical protein [Stylosanthes scabra]